MRTILLVLLAVLVSACGSSSTPTKAGGSAQGSGKAKVKGAKVKKKKKPFEAPPLESLADLGELKTAKLAGTSLKKLCPAKKRGKAAPGGCVCLPAGQASSSEVWEDNVASCTTAAEGLKEPLQNVQLLASQESPKKKRGEAPSLRANFHFMFETRKGWFSAALGSSEQQEGVGYARTLKLVSTEFVDFAAGTPGVLATFEETAAPFSAEDGGTPANRGFAIACIAADPKKIGCTEPLSLGEVRKTGGYQLGTVVQDGHLYLVETYASTPEELKSRSGKYAIAAP